MTDSMERHYLHKGTTEARVKELLGEPDVVTS